MLPNNNQKNSPVELEECPPQPRLVHNMSFSDNIAENPVYTKLNPPFESVPPVQNSETPASNPVNLECKELMNIPLFIPTAHDQVSTPAFPQHHDSSIPTFKVEDLIQPRKWSASAFSEVGKHHKPSSNFSYFQSSLVKLK